MRKKDKFDEIKPDAFKYQQITPRDEITPGFIFGVMITIAVGLVTVFGLAMLVASGIIFIGSRLI